MPDRVLVVEDDLLNRIFMADTLEVHGFVVKTIGDGAGVLAAAEAFRPHLITMDINLPSISGLELIEQLQADPEMKDVPIVAVTAYVGKGEEARIRAAGASGFLSKPISIRPFISFVRELLERRARHEPGRLSRQDPPSE